MEERSNGCGEQCYEMTVMAMTRRFEKSAKQKKESLSSTGSPVKTYFGGDLLEKKTNIFVIHSSASISVRGFSPATSYLLAFELFFRLK